MSGTVPDPPLHSSCFEEEGFLSCSRNVFGYYEGVDQALFQVLFRLHQCPHRARPVPDPPLHSAQSILAFRKKDFYDV